MKATIEVDKSVSQIHTIAKGLGGQVVSLKDVKPSEVEQLLRQAGSKIASVHFKKRFNNVLRKMCYRLNVKNPKSATIPKGNSDRKDVNKKNSQMTVFDVNKVVKDRDGNIKLDENGKRMRGAWRTVPLENVTRICVDGVVYEIAQ